jgi:hypothetical protein
LAHFQNDLGKFENYLKIKHEVMLQGMMQNFGSTTQNLPNIKLPAIVHPKGKP